MLNSENFELQSRMHQKGIFHDQIVMAIGQGSDTNMQKL
jgi:hypothetical protein